MYNVRLSPYGEKGDQKAAKYNRGLGGSMVSVKRGFRLPKLFRINSVPPIALTIVQIFSTQASHSWQVLRHQNKFVFEVNFRYGLICYSSF